MRALQIEARKRGDFGFKVRGSSKFRGVSKKSAKVASRMGNAPSNPKRWVANINESGGQSNFLGTFADEVAAARAYDQAALRVHGYNAKLNFPSEEIAQTAQREIDAERQSTGPRVSTRKGVKWDLELCKWIVHVDGSTLAPSSRPGSDSVGLFADEDGAALAYDRAWLEKHGDISDKKQQEQLSTLLNFPEQSWAWFRQQTHQRDGSKYRGVIWARHANNGLGQWKATIQGVSYRGRRSPAESTRVLGFFEDEASAARAYDKAALGANLNVPDAELNFPEERESVTSAEIERNRNYQGLGFKAFKATGSKKEYSSKFRGVTWLKRERKWSAQCSGEKAGRGERGGNKTLGNFEREEDAARAYDKEALRLQVRKRAF